MRWRRTARHAPADPPGARPALLMATVDTLPRPFGVLGLVHATTVVRAGDFPTNALLDMLESEASRLGADGVIGVSISQAAVPRSSQMRLVGQITDHYDSSVVATAIGTAVRWLPTSDAAAP